MSDSTSGHRFRIVSKGILERAANRNSQSRLIGEPGTIGYDEWFLRQAEEGLAQIDRREVLEHDEVTRTTGKALGASGVPFFVVCGGVGVLGRIMVKGF